MCLQCNRDAQFSFHFGDRAARSGVSASRYRPQTHIIFHFVLVVKFLTTLDKWLIMERQTDEVFSGMQAQNRLLLLILSFSGHLRLSPLFFAG